MNHNARSLRPFIGAKNFDLSRSFYRDLGFEERVISHTLSVFKSGEMAFYLQRYYVEDWVNNSMLFMEVQDVVDFWNGLVALNLPDKYKNIRLVPIKSHDWGRECLLIDPSGILWHFGEFNNQK